MQEAFSGAENIGGLMQLKLNDKYTNLERRVGDKNIALFLVGDISLEPNQLLSFFLPWSQPIFGS